MHVGVISLHTVVATKVHDEAVICMDVAGLIDGVIAPSRVEATMAVVMVLRLIGGAWGQSDVHQVGDVGLLATASDVLHGDALILIQDGRGKSAAVFMLGFAGLGVARSGLPAARRTNRYRAGGGGELRGRSG